MSAALRLARVHHSIGRAAEYFTANELEKQSGQPRSRFAAMAIKELADNALDAAETAGVAPEIGIEAIAEGGEIQLAISDNGPGLPPEIVARILDFSTRTSDKLAYRAPSRGLQGNALKTLIGLPVALGGEVPLVIESAGQRHRIRAHVDPLGQVVIEDETAERPTLVGTRVALTIPAAGQSLDPGQWARAFALLNPHASVLVKTRGFDATSQLAECDDPSSCESDDSYQSVVAFPDLWRKWVPGDPTSPHWYEPAALQTLLYGLPRETLLRDFVRQFDGLTGTQKAKAVTAHFPTIKRLGEIADDVLAVRQLLVVMQSEARPVAPKNLGLVGKDAIEARFADWYDVDRFWYEKRLGVETDGTPFVVEVAIAQTRRSGDVVYGLNFSPAFGDPLADSWLGAGKITQAHGIAGFLGHAHVLPRYWVEQDIESPPTAALVHIVSPRLTTLDRGKSRLAPSPTVVAAVGDALWRTTKTLYEEGQRRERDAARQARRDEARWREAARVERQLQWTLKEACYEVVAEAFAKASGNGTLPVSAHTLFYSVRPLVQRYTDEELTPSNFEQKILPAYERDRGALVGLYYEPRGTLYEPHTEKAVPLGTREVAGYEIPPWTYDKVLFVEKQGLWPPLHAAQLAERFDMAIVAGEGFATVAARKLLARADKDARHQIFVIHDADPSGYNIARTLAEETARMPGHTVEVVDLGLHFEQGLAMGLGTEWFTRRKALPQGVEPRLTEREREAFCGRRVRHSNGTVSWECERIELNAMTNPQLIAYIEDGLTAHGATAKVVPPAQIVAAQAHRDAQESLRRAAAAAIEQIIDTETLIEQFLASALAGEIAAKVVEAAARDAIVAHLEQHRALPWTAPVQMWASVTVNQDEEAIASTIAAMLADEERSV